MDSLLWSKNMDPRCSNADPLWAPATEVRCTSMDARALDRRRPNQLSSFGLLEHRRGLGLGGGLGAPHSDMARFRCSFAFISLSNCSRGVGTPMPRSLSLVVTMRRSHFLTGGCPVILLPSSRRTFPSIVSRSMIKSTARWRNGRSRSLSSSAIISALSFSSSLISPGQSFISQPAQDVYTTVARGGSSP